jgi:hypothetical protein
MFFILVLNIYFLQRDQVEFVFARREAGGAGKDETIGERIG